MMPRNELISLIAGVEIVAIAITVVIFSVITTQNVINK
jgi:hypothetical protein